MPLQAKGELLRWITMLLQVVGGVDYKGVREIMKNCIEKAQNLPADLDLSIRPQVYLIHSSFYPVIGLFIHSFIRSFILPFINLDLSNWPQVYFWFIHSFCLSGSVALL